MVECCQRCRALLPVSQFFGIQAVAEQRPTRKHRPSTQPMGAQASPAFAISPHPRYTGKRTGGKDLGQRWHVQHHNWAALSVKPFVFFRSSLLSLLPHVAPLCMVPSHHCLDTHCCFESGGNGNGMFHPAKQRCHCQVCSQGDAHVQLGQWLSCSHPAARLHLSVTLFRSKGSGWGTIPACGSSLGDVLPEDSSGLKSPCEHLAPKVAAAGFRGVPAAVPAPSPQQGNVHRFPRANKQERPSQNPPGPQEQRQARKRTIHPPTDEIGTKPTAWERG